MVADSKASVSSAANDKRVVKDALPKPRPLKPRPKLSKKLTEQHRGINALHLDANQAGQKSPAKPSSDVLDCDMTSDDGASQAKMHQE
eukprot:6596300-Karenia_brevis.AAC.1